MYCLLCRSSGAWCVGNKSFPIQSTTYGTAPVYIVTCIVLHRSYNTNSYNLCLDDPKDLSEDLSSDESGDDYSDEEIEKEDEDWADLEWDWEEDKIFHKDNYFVEDDFGRPARAPASHGERKPLDYFLRVFPANLFDQMAIQTNIYAQQKRSLKSSNFAREWRDIFEDDMVRFIACIIGMGCIPANSQWDYWTPHPFFVCSFHS